MDQTIIQRCKEVLENTHDGDWLTQREISCLQWLVNNYSRIHRNTQDKALYDLGAMEKRAMAERVNHSATF